MATIWVAYIGRPWFWPQRRWPENLDFTALEQKGITIRQWRTLQCVPPREDLLLVLLGAPYGPPLHFNRRTFTTISEILALYRSNRVKLSVIGPEPARPPSHKPEAGVWWERCQPIWAELLALRHVKSDALCEEWLRTGDVRSLVDGVIASGDRVPLPEGTAGPATLFFSYSHRDEDLRDGLAKHLKLLERTGLIQMWHDRRILAGDQWANAIETQLYISDVILLLISADFFASDYCSEIEATVALDRHRANTARAIPIILRPVVWSQSPLAELQALPKDAVPVTSWQSHDLAYVSICQGILAYLVAWKSGRDGETVRQRLGPPERYSVRRRILDAALPANIEVGRSAMLVMLIRKPTSTGLRGLLTFQKVYGIEPEQVQSSATVPLRFPLDIQTNRPEAMTLSIVVQAPEFDPPTQQRSITLEPEKDSQPLIMMMAATKPGNLAVVLELRHKDEVLVSCVVSACAGDKAPTTTRPC